MLRVGQFDSGVETGGWRGNTPGDGDTGTGEDLGSQFQARLMNISLW